MLACARRQYSNPEAYWNNLLDRPEQFVEAEQDASGLNKGNEDKNHQRQLHREDRDDGGHGVPENDGFSG